MLIPLGILAASGGGGGGAMELISTQILTSATNTVTFSSIPATYKHLQIRYTFLTTNGYPLLVRFNGDTANNFAGHRLVANGTSVSSQSTTSANFMYGFGVLAGASSTQPTAGVMDILDYTNTNKNKTMRNLVGIAGSSQKELGLFSGVWLSTSAVSSISLWPDTENLVIGSRFSLYGIKG